MKRSLTRFTLLAFSTLFLFSGCEQSYDLKTDSPQSLTAQAVPSSPRLDEDDGPLISTEDADQPDTVTTASESLHETGNDHPSGTHEPNCPLDKHESNGHDRDHCPVCKHRHMHSHNDHHDHHDHHEMCSGKRACARAVQGKIVLNVKGVAINESKDLFDQDKGKVDLFQFVPGLITDASPEAGTEIKELRIKVEPNGNEVYDQDGHLVCNLKVPSGTLKLKFEHFTVKPDTSYSIQIKSSNVFVHEAGCRCVLRPVAKCKVVGDEPEPEPSVSVSPSPAPSPSTSPSPSVTPSPSPTEPDIGA